jgi:hypothetical protein
MQIEKKRELYRRAAKKFHALESVKRPIKK